MRLHDVLLQLHSAPSLSALPMRILTGIRHLFPFDGGSIQDDRGGVGTIPWYNGEALLWQSAPTADNIEPRGMRVMAPWGPNFLPLREAFFAVSAERHPHTEYYRRTGDGSAWSISDIVPMRQLRRTAFYNEISRPLGVNWQLTIYLPLPAAYTLFVAALRQRTDFSRRERLLLELLRPHIGTAWLRAVRLDEQQAQIAPPLASIRPALEGQSASCSRILQRRLGLTAREAEVLFWLSEGKTNASIGVILERSPETVKSHVGSLLAKLGCETRTAAARTALESLGGD
jgi:DNA-binding CsgD family transcriptional regulator